MCTAPKSGCSRGECFLAVDWQDCGWCPSITVQMPLPPRRRVATKPLPMSSLLPYLSRHDPVFFKTMKTMPIHSRRPRAGFTIVELLTVISIIAILAAMLLPVLAAAKKHAQRVQAHLQAVDIATAIEKYDSDYGRFPVSTNAQIAAGTGDFTYGSMFPTPASGLWPAGTLISGVVVTNDEVVAILMDVTTNNITHQAINFNHVKNPQQTIFLTAKMSGYDPSVAGPAEGGVDVNGVYRDPWGNPYIISMDLNYDENCKDLFYCLDKVSGANGTSANPGLNGLVTDGTPNNFQYHGKVMVWSAGPDGKIDPNNNANTGVNKDNVVSWQ
ncbi:MAG: type II secretion system protein [Verrucomicrobiota bacterium]|jgi:prepilin-type N-terminal cleavage/methylation domain-containing protein